MPKYVVRAEDSGTGRALPAALVEASDGSAAAETATGAGLRVRLVEAYTPEMGSLPAWSEVLAQHQQSRPQPGRKGGGAIRCLLFAGIWLLSVALGAALFSGFAAWVDVRERVAEMEKVIEADRAGKAPNAEPSLRAVEAQRFIDMADLHQWRWSRERLGLAASLTALDSLLLLALAWSTRHWRWGGALTAMVVFGLLVSEIQQWVLYGQEVHGATSGLAYAGPLVCVVLGVAWVAVVRVFRAAAPAQ